VATVHHPQFERTGTYSRNLNFSGIFFSIAKSYLYLKSLLLSGRYGETETRNEVQKRKHVRLEEQERVKNVPISIGLIININNIKLFNWKTIVYL
jgi:hypothetical protein